MRPRKTWRRSTPGRILHGAKYRDFSASRAQTREKARQRVEQAMEEEHQRSQQGLEPKRGNGDTRREENVPQQAAQHPPRPVQAAAPPPDRPNPDWPRTEHPIRDDLASALRGLAVPPSYRQPSPAPHPPMREESYAPPRNPWSAADPAESAGRPAWLMPDRTEAASPSGLPPAPEDTLQGSRERLATRWYALRGVFEGSAPPTQAAPAPLPPRPPVMAVFSLAGGVGKTSLVATLGPRSFRPRRARFAGGHRGLRLVALLLRRRRSAPRHVAHLQPSGLQRRCAHSDDHSRSRDVWP